MEITDRIYGKQEISEKVLAELIKSESVQRLKGISQQGLPQKYYHRPIFSRYEHSVGVLMLLRKLDAGLEEQIAGLLHDISHTAFSHVVDWVIGNPAKEDYQDSAHLEIMKTCYAGRILAKYGWDYRAIADIERFGLLENKIPELCVDRFDYAIREFGDFGRQDKISGIVDSLVNIDGRPAFDSRANAEEFARGYCDCQTTHWAGDEAKTRYLILADILKYSLDRKIISITDFAKTDSEVIKLMLDSKDSRLFKTLRLLERPLKITKSENGGGFLVTKKLRYIDPLVHEGGELRRLSEISKGYRQILEQQKENTALRRVVVAGWPIK